MKRGKIIKRFLYAALLAFILINISAAFHAYKFTHFSSSKKSKTPAPQELSLWQKSAALFFGVSNPRPQNTSKPAHDFQTIKLHNNKFEAWLIKTDTAKGTAILFHGFSGDKSGLLNKADIFLNLGYNALVVDFRGSGGSSGNTTTIGYKEAEEVKAAMDYISSTEDGDIIVFGTSMGAVAIMRALNVYGLQPAAVILECPFGTTLETVQARFKLMNVPAFPMAKLLVFWGGTLNGFNAFEHNPSEYAKNIHSPVLLLYGEKDEKVSRKEIDDIYSNLNCTKYLQTFPLAGHEDYLLQYKEDWCSAVEEFLTAN